MRSCSVRILRDSMCAMKRSESVGSLCRTAVICFLAIRSTVVAVIALALPIRSACPARQPSPKKSPGPSIATIASRPDLESTDSFTPPCWMYMTLSHLSPCEKITSSREKLTILFANPAESRNACALNGTLARTIVSRYPNSGGRRCSQQNTAAGLARSRVSLLDEQAQSHGQRLRRADVSRVGRAGEDGSSLPPQPEHLRAR